MEDHEILRPKKGDIIILRVDAPIPAEDVAEFEASFKQKLPFEIRESVGVVLLGREVKIEFVKGADENKQL